MHTILVLSDGETYEILNDDIQVLTVTDDGLDQLNEGCALENLAEKDVVQTETLKDHFVAELVFKILKKRTDAVRDSYNESLNKD